MVRTYSRSLKPTLTSTKTLGGFQTSQTSDANFSKLCKPGGTKLKAPKKGGASKTKKTLKGPKSKKTKTVFQDSDNTSDFVSCNSTVDSSMAVTLSPDFSFKHKTKERDKENFFDDLFNNVKRDPSKPIFNSGNDSSSVRSNSSAGCGLFKSFAHSNIVDDESFSVVVKKKTTTGKVFHSKKVEGKKKEKEEPVQVFSEETIDFITQGLEKVSCNKDEPSDSIVGQKSVSRNCDKLSPIVGSDFRFKGPFSKLDNAQSPSALSVGPSTMVTSTPALPKTFKVSSQDVKPLNLEGSSNSSSLFVSSHLSEDQLEKPDQNHQRRQDSVDIFDISITTSQIRSQEVEKNSSSKSPPAIKEELVAVTCKSSSSSSSLSDCKTKEIKSQDAAFDIPSIIREALDISTPEVVKNRIRKTCHRPPSFLIDSAKKKTARINFNSRRTTCAVGPYPKSRSGLFGGRRRATVFVSTKNIDESILVEDRMSAEVLDDNQDGSFLNISRCSHKTLSTSYVISEDNQEVINSGSATNLVQKILAHCTNKNLVPLSGLYDDDIIKASSKIGEGAFGEVFLLATEAAPVLKIVPVGGSALVNGQPQTKLADILAEIIVSVELSQLKNFVEVRQCFLTSGEYPESLLTLWDKYDEEKTSENDRPDRDLFCNNEDGEEQKFVVLEFFNGGTDLEHVQLLNAAQGLAVFEQVAHALAVAEQRFEFEHRDLHWGNVLVRSCDEPLIEYRIDGRKFSVKTQKVSATIIDFSLSRLKSASDGCCIFNNLAEDEDLFGGSGDYQFDIYRMMKKETKNNWQQFHPKTNLFWLHYLLDKLIEEVAYKNTSSKLHKTSLKSLERLKTIILDFNSAQHFILAAFE